MPRPKLHFLYLKRQQLLLYMYTTFGFENYIVCLAHIDLCNELKPSESKPRSDVLCFKLNINISKLGYY